MKLVDRIDVETRRGVVRLLVGDLPDPFTVALSAEWARSLAADLEDAADAADAENDERQAELSASVARVDYSIQKSGDEP